MPPRHCFVGARTHAHCCYKLLKDTHMPNNTRATRVEGLERLRFSLARQNANGLHYLCLSSLACPCAPSHGQSDRLSRGLAHPWTKRDERCCCSFAAHHAYTHTLLLPHSLTLSLYHFSSPPCHHRSLLARRCRCCCDITSICRRTLIALSHSSRSPDLAHPPTAAP